MKTDQEYKSALIDLGRRIYHLRVIKELSIKGIAPQLHLSSVAYRNIEKGQCDLSFTKLLHIAKLLEIDISELLTPFTNKSHVTTSKIIKIVR